MRTCERWLADHFLETDTIRHAVDLAGIPECTLKRRFKAATGSTLIEYLQNLRIEKSKHLLETGHLPVDEISVAVSYEAPSFFRCLFKRSTGLTPSQYRRMFQPVASAGASISASDDSQKPRTGTSDRLAFLIKS